MTRGLPAIGPVLAAIGGTVLVPVLIIGDWFAFPERTIWTTTARSGDIDLSRVQPSVDGIGLGPLVLVATSLAAVAGISYLVSLLTGTMRRRTPRGTQLAFLVSLAGLGALAVRLLAFPPTVLRIEGPKEVAVHVLEITGQLGPSASGVVGLAAAACIAVGAGLDLLAGRARIQMPAAPDGPEPDEAAPAEARRSAAR